MNTQDMIRKIWGDVMDAERRIAAEEARANAAAHKLSPIFAGSLRFKYWATKNGRGSKVRFCYTVERNVAGYFLGWREVETAKTVKRSDYHASESKRDIKARTYRHFQSA